MAFHETIIPIMAILVAVAVPFILRGLSQATGQQASIDRRLDRIEQTLNIIGGDMKLHTNQISEAQIRQGRLEDRLREAEGDIIRLERNSNHGS